MNQKRDETAMSKSVSRSKKVAELSQYAVQQRLKEIEEDAMAVKQKGAVELVAKAKAEEKASATVNWEKDRETKGRQKSALDGAKLKLLSSS